ncbi:uncharacterized protein F5891DRAFT_713346 [Suillus fuscotomentosus]|uniref:Uncharacterized protein n=1 Tax=Suillus fuscotomentosus TaxID=1912939 RepID=A0AAD4DVB9_9AGAM|nr:uncharacterized protein F5891DRAFT_713346 [Suillus fuscotomentosus]KAG1894640.1 hypothetical protein F5891DRAFT_713346 [Suillus fuscotomentosus]
MSGFLWSCWDHADLTAVGSNDTIRSTLHRVRAPPDAVTKDGMLPDRYSIPYVSLFPLFLRPVADKSTYISVLCCRALSFPLLCQICRLMVGMHRTFPQSLIRSLVRGQQIIPRSMSPCR